MVIFETRHLTVSGGQFSWGGNLVTIWGVTQAIAWEILAICWYN